MKAVILAGGYGTRISEETAVRPKPLVEIGDRPILWHLMKLLAHQGITDFVIPLGYKGFMIKEYFANYWLRESDVTIRLGGAEGGGITVHQPCADDWRVTLVDTGRDTMTGGRLKRIRKYLNERETFLMTYGDGLADIELNRLAGFHQAHGKLATVTAVQPAGRFGALELLEDGAVAGFAEKPRGDGGWVNGGFFLLEPEALDGIEGDDTVFEQEPMRRLTAAGELKAYAHRGFWQPMDTLRDQKLLEAMWASGKAPWKRWSP